MPTDNRWTRSGVRPERVPRRYERSRSRERKQKIKKREREREREREKTHAQESVYHFFISNGAAECAEFQAPFYDVAHL